MNIATQRVQKPANPPIIYLVVSDRPDVSDAIGDEDGGRSSVLESVVYDVVQDLPSLDL